MLVARYILENITEGVSWIYDTPSLLGKFYLTLMPLPFNTSPLISSVLQRYRSYPIAVISQYLGGVMTLPLGDINPNQPASASYFLQLAVF